MKTLSVFAIVACLALANGTARSADAPPGATGCSGCHAAHNTQTTVPKITGRDAGEIVQAMAAFRSGARPSTVMGRIAKGFTDDEVKPIAAWLAAQK